MSSIRLTLVGDVALGRGLDQILSFPSEPTLYEPLVKDAREYAQLVKDRLKKRGVEQKRPQFWTQLLPVIHRYNPDVFLINLEVAITDSLRPWPKGINYKMNPQNICFLLRFMRDVKPAQLVCSVANNHILDWNLEGLYDTIKTLQQADIPFIGAGRNLEQAQKPFYFYKNTQRITVFAACHTSSGVDTRWKASEKRAGVFLLEDEYDENLPVFEQLIHDYSRESDYRVLICHIEDNWVYKINHKLTLWFEKMIDKFHFRLIVNTSSHHILPVVKYKNSLIVHGPGDFLNDYYGIENFEYAKFKPDCGSMVTVTISPKNIRSRRIEFERIGFDLYPRGELESLESESKKSD